MEKLNIECDLEEQVWMTLGWNSVLCNQGESNTIYKGREQWVADRAGMVVISVLDLLCFYCLLILANIWSPQYKKVNQQIVSAVFSKQVVVEAVYEDGILQGESVEKKVI